jgi:hypothetical protein
VVPWRVEDAVVLCLLALAGAALVAIAWYATSGSSVLSTQVVWVSVGVLGVVVSGTGNVVWLLSAWRAVGERHAALALRIQVNDHDLEAEATDQAPPIIAPTRDRVVVAGPKVTRYHRANCILVQGKRVGAAESEAHQAAGLEPCGVCRP